MLGFGLMAQLGRAGGVPRPPAATTITSARTPGRAAARRPPPPGSATLRHATILLPDEAERDRLLQRLADAGHDAETTDAGPLVRDPSGNGWVLVA